jgi:hypothetical protein
LFGQNDNTMDEDTAVDDDVGDEGDAARDGVGPPWSFKVHISSKLIRMATMESTRWVVGLWTLLRGGGRWCCNEHEVALARFCRWCWMVAPTPLFSCPHCHLCPDCKRLWPKLQELGVGAAKGIC